MGNDSQTPWRSKNYDFQVGIPTGAEPAPGISK